MHLRIADPARARLRLNRYAATGWCALVLVVAPSVAGAQAPQGGLFDHADLADGLA